MYKKHRQHRQHRIVRRTSLRVQDAVLRADREWFTRHPHAHSYARPFLPGELPLDGPRPHGRAYQLVVVTQLASGQCRRQCFSEPVGEPTTVVAVGPDGKVYDIAPAQKYCS